MIAPYTGTPHTPATKALLAQLAAAHDADAAPLDARLLVGHERTTLVITRPGNVELSATERERVAVLLGEADGAARGGAAPACFVKGDSLDGDDACLCRGAGATPDDPCACTTDPREVVSAGEHPVCVNCGAEVYAAKGAG